MKRHKAIRILDKVDLSDGWQFAVSVDQYTYSVRMRQDYYQEITAGKFTPDKLVEISFRFLLDQEKPEQILNKFDLAQIEVYFPNYKQEIKQYLK